MEVTASFLFKLAVSFHPFSPDLFLLSSLLKLPPRPDSPFLCFFLSFVLSVSPLSFLQKKTNDFEQMITGIKEVFPSKKKENG